MSTAVLEVIQADGQRWYEEGHGATADEARALMAQRCYHFLAMRHEGDDEVIDTLSWIWSAPWNGGPVVLAGYHCQIEVDE